MEGDVPKVEAITGSRQSPYPEAARANGAVSGDHDGVNGDNVAWWALMAQDVADRLAVDPTVGLAEDEVKRRLERYGPNELAQEPPPSILEIARGQLANPMNVMLILVAIASFAIDQIATGVIVAVLVTFNVVMGTTQEKKARASVEALAQLQVPHARVRRDGRVAQVAAASVVPGDVVLVEAGDLVPADGRVLTSATLEVQEAALTGESAPVAKDAVTVVAPDTALGDRINMAFQNTSVTRGSASLVVTATGQATQMGHIADMVSVPVLSLLMTVVAPRVSTSVRVFTTAFCSDSFRTPDPRIVSTNVGSPVGMAEMAVDTHSNPSVLAS